MSLPCSPGPQRMPADMGRLPGSQAWVEWGCDCEGQKHEHMKEHRLHSRIISYLLWFLPNLHRVDQETNAKRSSSGRSAGKERGGETSARPGFRVTVSLEPSSRGKSIPARVLFLRPPPSHTTLPCLWHTRCVCVCVPVCGWCFGAAFACRSGKAGFQGEEEEELSCACFAFFAPREQPKQPHAKHNA